MRLEDAVIVGSSSGKRSNGRQLDTSALWHTGD
jgi:hypothetical protein